MNVKTGIMSTVLQARQRSMTVLAFATGARTTHDIIISTLQGRQELDEWAMDRSFLCILCHTRS
jgi:hypothetical protein